MSGVSPSELYLLLFTLLAIASMTSTQVTFSRGWEAGKRSVKTGHARNLIKEQDLNRELKILEAIKGFILKEDEAYMNCKSCVSVQVDDEDYVIN
ncbi:Uncharacterised protein g6763 [Pycnogonum litorale]